MPVSFSGSELVEIAIQMEKNGLSFYETAADRLEDPKTKDLLHALARDESEHLRLFQQLMTSGALSQVHESYPGEYVTYMQAHVDGQIFTEQRMKKLIAEKTLPARNAIDLAVESEKSAILYYSEMLCFVPSSDQTTVQRIIAEEKRHLAELVSRIKELGPRVDA